jgi:hypothetical protein
MVWCPGSSFYSSFLVLQLASRQIKHVMSPWVTCSRLWFLVTEIWITVLQCYMIRTPYSITLPTSWMRKEKQLFVVSLIVSWTLCPSSWRHNSCLLFSLTTSIRAYFVILIFAECVLRSLTTT